MSWKGFSRGVTRAPQTIKQKFSLGDNTKDGIYQDAERRFQELEKETKKLHEESKKYFDAINGMLLHQIEFSQAIAEIYRPISGHMSDPDSYMPEGNVEGIRACEEYEAIVRDLQAVLEPELEIIESRVIRPADELLEVIKVIQKTTVKRDHKKIDHDRHRTNLKKLQDKKEKTLKDEKALYKAETDVELATQEFNYFNDLLKDELPKLFKLEKEFIKPLFQSFYYMQLNVFYTLHEKMRAVDIGYFNLTDDVEHAFQLKRGDAEEQAQALAIIHFKTTGGLRRPGQGKTSLSGPSAGGRQAIEYRPSASPSPSTTSTALTPIPQRLTSDSSDHPPPPYSASARNGAPPKAPSAAPVAPKSAPLGLGRASSSASSWGAIAKAKGAAPLPPKPKPKPARLSAAPAVETVTALYDYEAQAEGDLSFQMDDAIEIIKRTDNENEWWTGRINGREGQFPGNYVRLNR